MDHLQIQSQADGGGVVIGVGENPFVHAMSTAYALIHTVEESQHFSEEEVIALIVEAAFAVVVVISTQVLVLDVNRKEKHAL